MAKKSNKPPITVTMDDLQKVTLSAAPLDQDGEALSGAQVAWASSDETIVSVTPSADTLSCECGSVKVGTATVTASLAGSPDLDETADFAVVNSAPGALNLTAAPPASEAGAPPARGGHKR